MLKRSVAIASLAALALMAGAVLAGTAPATSTSGPGYICTKDKVGSEKAGPCPICNTEMKKAGTYVCPMCDTTSDKAGTCPCGKAYVKAELAGKKCPGCGYYIPKDATSCAVCKAKAAATKPS